MAFKMRSKPVMPKRKNNYCRSYSIYDGCSLAGVVEHFAGDDFSKVIFNTCRGYYDEVETDFTIQDLEPEEIFEKRMEDYNKRLAKYNEWYDKNKEKIEEELERRRQAALIKKEKDLQAAKKRAEKELVKIERQLRRKK